MCATRLGALGASVLGVLVFTLPVLPRAFSADFTFYAWGDPHFDYWNDLRQRDDLIDDMNRLPGTPYPASLGGAVAVPDFVLALGDITDRSLPSTWSNTNGDTNDDFIECISRLRYPPVWTIRGNHDNERPDIVDALMRRHGELYFSFDHRGVHFVGLDIVSHVSAGEPEQLEWLRADLARISPGTPVIVFTHYGPEADQPGWSDLAAALAGHYVIAFIHGHEHHVHTGSWAGIDVYSVGHNRYDDPNNAAFAVVRVTNTRLSIASYHWAQDRWYAHSILDKAITGLPRADPAPSPTPTPVPMTPNLLVNGALETFQNGMAVGWTAVSPEGTMAFREAAGMGGSGVAQGIVTAAPCCPVYEGLLYQRVSVEPGERYTVSAYGRPENGIQEAGLLRYGIGVDPAGGVSFDGVPAALRLVRHTADQGYGDISWNRFEVEFEATSPIATIYLWGRSAHWTLGYVRVSWDKARLARIEVLPASFFELR